MDKIIEVLGTIVAIPLACIMFAVGCLPFVMMIYGIKCFMGWV